MGLKIMIVLTNHEFGHRTSFDYMLTHQAGNHFGLDVLVRCCFITHDYINKHVTGAQTATSHAINRTAVHYSCMDTGFGKFIPERLQYLLAAAGHGGGAHAHMYCNLIFHLYLPCIFLSV